MVSLNILRLTSIDATETLQHAMFDGPGSQSAGTALLQGLRKAIPTITPLGILTLDFDCQEDITFVCSDLDNCSLPLISLAVEVSKET